MDLNVLIGIVVGLGGIGFGIGQFFSARRKGVSDSLEVALREIEALKQRVGTLETDKDALAASMREKDAEIAVLRRTLLGIDPNQVDTLFKKLDQLHVDNVLVASKLLNADKGTTRKVQEQNMSAVRKQVEDLQKRLLEEENKDA